MEALKILEKPDSLHWDYDEEADVLYLSIGKPTPAVGVDIGEGVVVRYDETKKQIVVSSNIVNADADIIRAILVSNGCVVQREKLPNGREVLRIRAGKN